MTTEIQPALDRGVEFDECLSFSIRGEWGHFRRVDGNIVKQTYRIMPRTTISGMLAAVLGMERNSYYDLFQPDNSAIAIEPTAELRTMNMPINSISTNDDARIPLPNRRKKATLRVEYPRSTRMRQQYNYEFLVNPEYRIDVWLDDETTYTALRERLENGESYYTPSLGLSEHLATIEYHGEQTVDHGGTAETADVDSAVPGTSADVIPTQGVQYKSERSPGFMEAERNGPRVQRTTTGFLNWLHTDGTGDQLTVADKPVSTVDGRTVVFA